MLLILLAIAVIIFILRIVRYDLTSVIILVSGVFLGVIPVGKMFTGFSNSAFITVAAIFIISRAIEETGILERFADKIRLRRLVCWKQIGLICLVELIISSLINSVAAAALMIPIALKIARIKNISSRILLMPLAFSALLGGLVTLIGTPSNLIISDYRMHYAKGAFTFFDFTPVGLTTALVGIAFMVFLGWRLIPALKSEETTPKGRQEKFTVELKIKGPSFLIDKKIAHVMQEFEGKFQLLALVRDEEVIQENLNYYTFKNNDAIILETDKWMLHELIRNYKFELEPGNIKSTGSEHFLTEIVLLPQSSLCDEKISAIDLKNNYGFEIVAVSRGETTLTQRLGEIKLTAGDALLIKSNVQVSQDQLDSLHCLILEESIVKVFSFKTTLKVLAIFGIALVGVISGLIRADIAFFAASIAMILLGCLTLEKAYLSLELPILVLIAAMIPVGEAMQTSGTASLIAQAIYTYGQVFPIGVNLFILIWASILISNFINNTAVALIFAPIALQIASHWHASPDPFLMGVAVGVSCVFLTPIGHPANTIIMTPGNFRFSEYWQMGLPLTFLVSIAATVLIMIFWPFHPQ